MSMKRLCCVLLVVLVGLEVGCGGVSETKLPESGAKLTGTISLDGVPVEFALVTVQGPNGSAIGKVMDDGKYVVENVPLGQVSLGVNTQAAKGDYQSKMMSMNAGAVDPKSSKKIKAVKFVDVPAKFFDPNSSGLSTTVEKGTHEFNLELKK